MSKCVLETWPYIQVLAHASPRLIRVLLNEANSSLIKCLIELFTNIHAGHLPLTAQARQFLHHRQKLFWKIINPKTGILAKKKELIKHGPKLFPFLLPIVIEQLSE